MIRMAVEEFFPPGFPVKVSSIEVDHGESIPTVYLMDQLNEKYGETHSFHFIMGSDLIKSLHWWDEGDRIINEMPIIIFRRKGYDNDSIFSHENFPKNNPIVVDEGRSLIGVISSTEVRRRVHENVHLPYFGISGLVTKNIIEYLTDNGLYRDISQNVDLFKPRQNIVLERTESAMQTDQ